MHPASQAANQHLLWLIVGVIVFFLLLRRRKRSRHIPVKSKRLAEARLIQKHYSNPQTADKPLRLKDYEFDHDVPFSKGGSHESANINLIPKKKNRKKGAKIKDIRSHFIDPD